MEVNRKARAGETIKFLNDDLCGNYQKGDLRVVKERVDEANTIGFADNTVRLLSGAIAFDSEYVVIEGDLPETTSSQKDKVTTKELKAKTVNYTDGGWIQNSSETLLIEEGQDVRLALEHKTGGTFKANRDSHVIKKEEDVSLGSVKVSELSITEFTLLMRKVNGNG